MEPLVYAALLGLARFMNGIPNRNETNRAEHCYQLWEAEQGPQNTLHLGYFFCQGFIPVFQASCITAAFHFLS